MNQIYNTINSIIYDSQYHLLTIVLYKYIFPFLFEKCSNMNIIWVLWIFETIGAHRWWCILFIYVPCCQTIMMSLVVIVCYQEKCRQTKTRQYFSWIWLWLLCTVAMETKNTTMVTYFESPRSLLYVHQVWMKYLHKL